MDDERELSCDYCNRADGVLWGWDYQGEHWAACPDHIDRPDPTGVTAC